MVASRPGHCIGFYALTLCACIVLCRPLVSRDREPRVSVEHRLPLLSFWRGWFLPDGTRRLPSESLGMAFSTILLHNFRAETDSTQELHVTIPFSRIWSHLASRKMISLLGPNLCRGLICLGTLQQDIISLFVHLFIVHRVQGHPEASAGAKPFTAGRYKSEFRVDFPKRRQIWNLEPDVVFESENDKQKTNKKKKVKEK